MNSNILPSNRAPIVGVINPDANAAGVLTTDWISMANFGSIMAIIMAGELGASATIDAKLEQATDDSGTGAKDVDNKAITQLTKASNDNNEAVINCRSEELDIANDFAYVRLSMTVGVATSDSAAIVLGFDARYQPADDLATVVEVVA